MESNIFLELKTSLSLSSGYATVLKNGPDIVEVEVDESVYGNDLGNGLGGDAERVVGLAEGGRQREVGIDFTEALVVDDEQGIDVLGHLLYAVERLVNLLGTLEAEGDGDDTYGKDAHLLGDACDDRSSTSTRAAAHAGGDEGHARAVAQHGFDVVEAFFGSLPCALRLVARTESFGTEL